MPPVKCAPSNSCVPPPISARFIGRPPLPLPYVGLHMGNSPKNPPIWIFSEKSPKILSIIVASLCKVTYKLPIVQAPVFPCPSLVLFANLCGVFYVCGRKHSILRTLVLKLWIWLNIDKCIRQCKIMTLPKLTVTVALTHVFCTSN